ncbi:hypothetical protein J6590_037931 [Homalodisca vitripennis]|nr:hypothetical protein J6590_037931 [Homalodisca vitripennis]
MPDCLCKDRGETDYTAASDKKRCERHVLPDCNVRIKEKQIIQQPVTRNVVNGMSCQTVINCITSLSWYSGILYKSKKSKECLILPGEVRAKKPSLTLNLGTNGLKVTSEPPPMAGQAGRLQGQDRSAVTYPSSGHARRCLIWLSCDNRRTRYTAPLVLTCNIG